MFLIQMKKYWNRITFLLTILVMIFIIYSVNISLKKYESISSYLVMYQTILPRNLIKIIMLLTLAYFYAFRKEYSVIELFQMKNRLTIWKNKIVLIHVIASVDITIYLVTFIIGCIYKEVQSDGTIYTLLALISFYLQLSTSLTFIELIEWRFSSKVTGMLIVLAVGISDAYTTFFSDILS